MPPSLAVISPTKGMLPPQPMNTGATPKPRSQGGGGAREHRVVGGAAPGRARAQAGDGQLHAGGRVRAQMRGERGVDLLGLHVGHDADAEPRPRRVHHHVAGLPARAGLDGVDRQRRPAPHAAVHVDHVGVAGAGEQAGLLGEALRRVGQAPVRGGLGRVQRAHALVDAGDGDVAARVAERGDEPAQRLHRVRHGAAPHAGVQRRAQRLELDLHPDQAAQAGGQRRQAGVEVGGVRDHQAVGAQFGQVRIEEAREVLRADLLLALDHHRQVDRRPARRRVPRRRAGAVDGDAGLVVGRTARVQAAVPLGRLEHRRAPQVLAQRRLHVVVGVQQQRRGARARAVVLGDDVREHPRQPRDARLGVARRQQPVDARLGAALEVRVVEAGEAARRDAHQLLEARERVREVRFGAGDGGGDGVGHGTEGTPIR